MDFREKILKEGVLKHRQTSYALPRVSLDLVHVAYLLAVRAKGRAGVSGVCEGTRASMYATLPKTVLDGSY